MLVTQLVASMPCITGILVSSCIIVLLVISSIPFSNAQWFQQGFNSVHSNQSPYNTRDISGICTMWTSYEVPSNVTMRSMAFPILQTNDSMYIIYKNVVLDAESGSILMNWDFNRFGYAVAIANISSNEYQSIIITVRPAPSNMSMSVAAYTLPKYNDMTANQLSNVWMNDALRITSDYELVLDEEYTQSLIIYFADKYLLHLTALDIRTGASKWSHIYVGSNIGGVVASRGKVYLLVVSQDPASSKIICLDGISGDEIWNEPADSLQRLFTLIEYDDVLIGSAFTNATMDFYYLTAFDIQDGTVLWNQSDFFERLIPNVPILNVAQVRKTEDKCIDGIQLLVSRKDGLLTTCTTLNSTTTNGTYWINSSPMKPYQNSMNILSLSEPEKNVISISSQAVYDHKILFYRTIYETPSSCNLNYHEWHNPIQGGGPYKYIYVAAEKIQTSAFRIVAMDTQTCRIFPKCPYFEFISRSRLAIGLIVLIALNACCITMCAFCFCYCCKACNPEKSATNMCRNCSHCCDMSLLIARFCEATSNCYEHCCCGFCGRSYDYFDSYPEAYASSNLSSRYNLMYNLDLNGDHGNEDWRQEKLGNNKE